MPKFASFDHTAPPPQLITGYYDTDGIDYATMKDPADMFEMTEAQWAARVSDPSVIDNGEIVILPPPPPTPRQQADMELATRKAAGIAITCTSNAAIDATYALDDRSVALVGSIARDVASGLDFPAGATTFDYPDIDGTPHTFDETQFVAFYKALRDLTNVLVTQANVLADGGTPAWPVQAATIP